MCGVCVFVGCIVCLIGRVGCVYAYVELYAAVFKCVVVRVRACSLACVCCCL